MRPPDFLSRFLEDLNRRWMHAYVTRDVEFLQRHMHPDYVGTFPDGSVHDKPQEIASVREGRIAIERMSPLEMQVQVHGETAVLTGRSSILAEVAGTRIEGELRFTDVWASTAEGWRAVASHVTRIAD